MLANLTISFILGKLKKQELHNIHKLNKITENRLEPWNASGGHTTTIKLVGNDTDTHDKQCRIIGMLMTALICNKLLIY